MAAAGAGRDFDELLDGLQGVEDSGGGGCGDGEAFAVGDDGVALGLHGFGHVGFGWSRRVRLEV